MNKGAFLLYNYSREACESVPDAPYHSFDERCFSFKDAERCRWCGTYKDAFMQAVAEAVHLSPQEED